MENKKLVLIIDDEPDFIETMRFFLENSNFRVVTASSGEEGLEKAILKPDIILLDLMMPKMNGHQVCKRLKELPDSVSIPVIMLTCKDVTLDKVEAFNLGVADYIGKHFPFEEILARIKAALRITSPVNSLLSQQDRNNKILELRKIIDEKKVRILFQPIVSLDSRIPMGYEALTRGPQGSFLENPVNLFTLANEENMFYEIDRICLGLAAQKAAFSRPGMLLFLNTDPTVFEKDYFKNLDFIKNSHLTPPQICIEITERTCIKNFTKFYSNLSDFRAQGVKVAIDDVGEGYSSLKAIAELKPEFIKADMGLVRNVHMDGIKSTILQTIADLTRKIGGHLIAEGVETEEELKALIALGIEYGQGYLFAKPSENPA